MLAVLGMDHHGRSRTPRRRPSIVQGPDLMGVYDVRLELAKGIANPSD
jgi:hypothetical protein